MKRDGELEPELDAFVSARKIVRRAPPEVRARAMAGARRILAQGGRQDGSQDGLENGWAGVPPRRSLPSELPLRRAGGRRSLIRIGLAASVALAAGTVWAVVLVRGQTAAPPPVAEAAVTRPVPERDEGPAAPPPVSPPAAEPRLSGRTRHAAADADPFKVQLALLQRAQAAYTRGDFSGALALLAEHARRFPRGHLAEEREALRVRSLLGAGRRQEARHAAALFARQFPRSVLLPSLQDEERAVE